MESVLKLKNNKTKLTTLTILICMNQMDREKWKEKAFSKGYNLSQNFKNYQSWDDIVEPFLIRQFAFFFGVCNSFIKGLVSDNKNNNLDEEIREEICSKKN